MKTEVVKIVKHFMRLSAERDLYTIQQAAFRMNISRARFEDEYVKSGRMKLKFERGRMYVPKSEIERCINEMKTVLHKNHYKQFTRLGESGGG